MGGVNLSTAHQDSWESQHSAREVGLYSSGEGFQDECSARGFRRYSASSRLGKSKPVCAFRLVNVF